MVLIKLDQWIFIGKGPLNFEFRISSPILLCDIAILKYFECCRRLLPFLSSPTGYRINVALHWRIGNLKNTHISAHRSVPRQPYIGLAL